jgi:hypothetical protein
MVAISSEHGYLATIEVADLNAMQAFVALSRLVAMHICDIVEGSKGNGANVKLRLRRLSLYRVIRPIARQSIAESCDRPCIGGFVPAMVRSLPIAGDDARVPSLSRTVLACAKTIGLFGGAFVRLHT